MMTVLKENSDDVSKNEIADVTSTIIFNLYKMAFKIANNHKH